MNLVWFSGASDETGKAIAGDLDYKYAQKTPNFPDITNLICWGAKGGTKYDPSVLNAQVTAGKLRVLNHPDRIAQNKDKLWMLERFLERGIPAPGFVNIAGLQGTQPLDTIKAALDAGTVCFPLLLMNKSNQGQPSCVYTLEELEVCVLRGSYPGTGTKPVNFDIARSFAHGAEFRIHVFRDSVIWAQTKTVAADPVASTAASLLKKLERTAKKAEKTISATSEEVTDIVRMLSEDLLLGPHHYQRTVGRGCELEDYSVTDLAPEIMNAAIRALDAVELDMGAVNLSFDGEQPQITNVISYPALDDKQRAAYVSAIVEFVGTEEVAEKNIPSEGADTAAPELVARLRRKIDSLSGKKAAELLKELGEE